KRPGAARGFQDRQRCSYSWAAGVREVFARRSFAALEWRLSDRPRELSQEAALRRDGGNADRQPAQAWLRQSPPEPAALQRSCRSDRPQQEAAADSRRFAEGLPAA